MGVRARRGQWPDRDGNYRFVDGRGRHLLLVIDDRFGPDTEAVAERILVAINGDTVPAPTLPEDVGELVRLKSWKAEATEVIAGWERVWDAMGRPGRLGRPKSEGCLEALVAASPVPDLPSWVSMHATATGADLIEHDPNGEVWERWLNGENWWADHADIAAPTWLYLVRRRPQPSTPDVVKVPWAESLGRRIPDGREITAIGYRSGNPHPWFEVDGGGDFLPDGTVEVLRRSTEDGER